VQIYVKDTEREYEAPVKIFKPKEKSKNLLNSDAFQIFYVNNKL